MCISVHLMDLFVGLRILFQYQLLGHLAFLRIHIHRHIQDQAQMQVHLVQLINGGMAELLFQMEFLHAKFVRLTAKLALICWDTTKVKSTRPDYKAGRGRK